MEFVKSHWKFFLISATDFPALHLPLLMKVMLDAGGVKAYRGGNFLNNFLLSFYVFINNIKLLIFTINYSAAYAMKIPTPVLSPPVLLAIVDTLLLAAVSLWSLKKTKSALLLLLLFRGDPASRTSTSYRSAPSWRTGTFLSRPFHIAFCSELPLTDSTDSRQEDFPRSFSRCFLRPSSSSSCAGILS